MRQHSDQPKIAFLVSNLLPTGSSQFFSRLACELSKTGYEVEYVVKHALGTNREVVDSEANLVDLGVEKKFTLPFKIAQYIDDSEPDLIISPSRFTNTCLAAGAGLTQEPVKIIMRESNHISRIYEEGENWFDYLLPYFVRNCYPAADAVVAPSRGIARELERITDGEVGAEVIHNLLDGDKIRNRANNQVEHQFFQTSEPLLVSAGRLVPQKDFFTLLEAMEIVNQEKSARLIILGDGYQLEELKERTWELDLEKVVDFAGYVDNPFPWIKRADLFVLTSAWESFGNVILESLALGTPVVATDCEFGPAEILKAGEYGFLAEVGDADEVARGIIQTLEEPPSAKKLRGRAKYYRPEKIIVKYRELIERVLE